MTPLKIVFAGTPEFAVPPLQALIDSSHQLLAVYTQPDRPAGRGRKLTASPIKQLAESAGIPVRQPVSLKGDDAHEALAELKPDLMVVVAYGLILPQSILEAPRLGCWNIHASLLPRWRGAAPIQRAILAGDHETGVCIMQMDPGLDTGPVLARSVTPIDAQDTAADLHDRLAQMGARALMDCLCQPEQQRPEAQSEVGVTYANKLSKAEARLDWAAPAAELDRAIRAFNPWPVAQLELAGETLRVFRARPLGGPRGEPGELLAADASGIVVACGRGALRLLEIQRPGGRRLPVADYLNARPELRSGP